MSKSNKYLGKKLDNCEKWNVYCQIKTQSLSHILKTNLQEEENNKSTKYNTSVAKFRREKACISLYYIPAMINTWFNPFSYWKIQNPVSGYYCSIAPKMKHSFSFFKFYMQVF